MLETLRTSPMCVAVEFDVDGRRWSGRVSEWIRTPDSWWAHVLPEPGNYKIGGSSALGGWMPADQLEPAKHKVVTAHGTWEWWAWSPAAWPAQLERFAGAAWNEHEYARADEVRPAGVPLPDPS